MQRVVNVAAGIIERDDGTFLLSRRPSGKVYEGHWEFPGGKIEPDELTADALARELREELGIEVEVAYPWITTFYIYQHAAVRLHFFRVVRWRGDASSKEGQALSWQSKKKLTVGPMLPANATVLRALCLPIELGITCAWEVGIEPAIKSVRLALERGLRLVQIREANLTPALRGEFAAEINKAVREVDGILVINSDVKLAMSLGAGLHLPSRELMATNVRPHVDWCSASCHSRAELDKANDLGLDFVLLGPVERTPSHADVSPMGWDEFEELVRNYPVPVFALGGMRVENLDAARRRGAHGIAMLRGAWNQQQD
jgi:8-oxo-dGTP diphosphatase